MKFMKLGSKPDVFQSEGSNVRYVSSELPTDVTVDVGDTRFCLHKFPLLSKCGRLQRLIFQGSEESTDEFQVDDFPGGPKAFEICAKFCYGMTVTLNAYNVVAIRCAAEYLEMTEDIDKGNLIYKLDLFLSSSVFRSWKDSIIVLQITPSLLPWSEDLKIIARSIESVSSKVSLDPSDVHWSYTYRKRLSLSNQIVESGVTNQSRMQSVPMDWWIEDICDLDLDLYQRVMVAVKAKGKVPANVMGEALRAYAIRWLPNSTDLLVCDDYARRNRSLLETIIRLLPPDKGSGCSCSFLLKLLKVVIKIGIEYSLKEELLDRIGSQLERASVKDLLIPAISPCGAAYDVHLVQSLVNRHMIRKGSSQACDFVEEGEKVSNSFGLGDGSLPSVGKLIDGYLFEIASDSNLALSSFFDLSRSLPDAARASHDRLYAAIDVYLQEHASLTKEEKKKICGLMDVRKLSASASLHASQNERLPLRTVVQVLFFEWIRSAAADLTEPSSGISRMSIRTVEDVRQNTTLAKGKSLKKQFDSKEISNDESLSKEIQNTKNDRNRSSGHLFPSRSRRIFDKLWSGKMQIENKSSETSVFSSPSASSNPVEAKSAGSCSRNRRISIS